MEKIVINPDAWMAELLPRLQQAFGSRLQYLGLQGSYRRGEARETSDIDVVVLLDGVALEDLDTYRVMVRAMPEGQKACGFISGIAELLHWPRHELFAFQQDTVDYFGTLSTFLPVLTERDAAESVRVGASALIHMLTHSYLYADAETRFQMLQEAYKTAFFVMRSQHHIASGVFCRSKKELLSRLAGTEKEIIAAGCDLPDWLTAHTEKEAYAMLLRWCRDVLSGCGLCAPA